MRVADGLGCPRAATVGIAHEIVQTHELDNPNYASNPVNRCDVPLFWWWASADDGRCRPDY